jgi:threonine aldolase
MAQLIALRVHADRSGRSCVGIHPSSHHLVEEHNSLQVLHALEPRQLCPWERPIRAVDITGASNNLAAVSVELPIRWIGGQMQSWQELTEIKDACVRLGIALHVDGARLWECQPGLGRSLKDICSGCSSVYVSFYKSIGATGGAMLVGQTDFIAEARLWRRRHGGDIFQLWPYVASAEMRMERALERMPSDFARAGRWAKMLGESGVAVTPSIPQTPMFHICARADVATVIAKRDEIARDVRIWVTGWIKQVSNQEFVAAEIQPGPWSDALTDEEAVAAMVTLTE